MMRSFPLLTALLSSWAFPTAAQDCYSDLTLVSEAILAADVDSPLTIVLCPDTVFELGFMEPGAGFVDGQPPIMTTRSNTKYSCGEDGSSSNKCVLRGGDFGILAMEMGGTPSNISIHGMTLDGQAQYAMFLNQSGDFLIHDCIFQNSNAFGPILIDLPEQFTADINFEECIFQNNTQREVEPGVEFGVLTIRGPGATVEVSNCIFQSNQYGDESATVNGYAINNQNGNGLILKNSCFFSNDFLGTPPVVLYESTFFSLIGNQGTSDGECTLAEWYVTKEARENGQFQCIQSQSDLCRATIYLGDMEMPVG